jgi:NAD(P)-dependent dehydrogenase (short-subunit alcohol dehydrogenase family)
MAGKPSPHRPSISQLTSQLDPIPSVARRLRRAKSQPHHGRHRVFLFTQKLLPLMSDGGRIVNGSTGLTRMTFPGSAPYASMKGAVEVLTRFLAKELGPRNIAVSTVLPGAIATDFSGGVVRDNPESNKRIADMTALGRAGLPDDIGPMIASLLSEDGRSINGQRIEVSGGMMV